MNLNNQPTIDELAEMFAAQKDTLDDHVLWIGKSGEVQLDCLAPNTQEAEFDRDNRELAAPEGIPPRPGLCRQEGCG